MMLLNSQLLLVSQLVLVNLEISAGQEKSFVANLFLPYKLLAWLIVLLEFYIHRPLKSHGLL